MFSPYPFLDLARKIIGVSCPVSKTEKFQMQEDMFNAHVTSVGFNYSAWVSQYLDTVVECPTLLYYTNLIILGRDKQIKFMKHLINFIKFILYIILCLTILWGVQYCIGFLISKLYTLSLSTLIIATIFGSSIIIGVIAYLIVYVIGLLNKLNPYKQIAKWIVNPIAILFLIVELFVIWKVADLSQSRNLIIILLGSALLLYSTITFCVTVYSDYDDNNIG